MTTSDGHVVGVTKVVDHGPDSARWNLVIVGDGYQQSELATYHTHVQSFIDELRSTPPFNELFAGINVHRIDVVSTQSGADDPACAGGTATTTNTYFDATFCTNFAGSPLDRLLSVNSTEAISVANTYVPLKHQVLCIVNSTKYGGSGGAIATCSVHPQANNIAIHEMGHSAFGLADEYGGNGSGTPSGEPSQPNVTRDTNRNTNKWRTLILGSTPMPSQCDGSCASSTCVPPGTPPAAGAVGTYEGAIYSDCNTYRPLPSCYMRDYGPFCPVCANVIRQVLSPFQPAETITLVTPSVSFTNVPAGVGGVGVTTYRAIRWDVVTSRNLRFTITAGPTGGFGLPYGGSVTVTADPIIPAAAARIYLSYTSTNPGDTASGTVTARCVETGQTWTINIAANTVSRPRTAVSLVLDRSGSMTEDAGDAVPKITKLREAARVFLDVMLPNDGVGVVRFNDVADRLMEVEDAGAAPSGSGRINARGHIDSNELDPGGGTSIGDGVVKGRDMLDDAQATAAMPYDGTAMVVLTDGMWNVPPTLADVAGSIDGKTFAVGLGLPSNISVPALSTLCQGHSGYMLVTGQLTSDQSMRLSKYFLQILAGVTNAQVAADPPGLLEFGSTHRIPFWINEADFGLDAIMLSPFPQAIDFQLEAPDGTLIDPSSGGAGGNCEYVQTNGVAYYRCALPILPSDPDGTHAGQWHAVLRRRDWKEPHKGEEWPRKPVPYEFVAHTYSSLIFEARLWQGKYEVGSIAELSASLMEYDVPLTVPAKVWVEIEGPKGAGGPFTLPLNPRGDGTYWLDFEMTYPGTYLFRVRAYGESSSGLPYSREQTLTGVVVREWNQGNHDHPRKRFFTEKAS